MNCWLCERPGHGRMIAPYVGRAAVHFACFEAEDRASEAREHELAPTLERFGWYADLDTITAGQMERARRAKRKGPQKATPPGPSPARLAFSQRRRVEAARRRLAARGIQVAPGVAA